MDGTETSNPTDNDMPYFADLYCIGSDCTLAAECASCGREERNPSARMAVESMRNADGSCDYFRSRTGPNAGEPGPGDG